MTRDITPASDGDLPEIPTHQVESALRGHRPLGCAPEVSRAADLMNALRAPADRSELEGYQRAMDAFGVAFPKPRTRSTRIAMFNSVAGIRALATATGAAVALGAVATVLVTSGAMGPDRPVRVQPVATSSTSSTDGKSEKADPDKGKPKTAKTAKTANGVGPDATGPAAVGLCNAWSNHPDKGKSTRSVAFRNLAKAAGGEGKIAAYCAKIPRPSDAADDESPETKGAKPSKTAKPSKPSKTAEATETAHPSQGAQTSTTHPNATSSSSSSSAGTPTPAPQSTTPGSTGTGLAPR